MRIEKIILRNFRNHEQTMIDFPTHVSVITGLNASGKSTVKEAVMYALCGEGRHDILKKDLLNLISYGQAKAEVEIRMRANDTTLKIIRSRTASGESLKVE